ncbi:TlpA family protein disulfide reductase [Aquimarina sp. D1M17]|uniref:peroxiredoxin family protein n=1 Tax=Aquimarina acroporae TaxID=2937283 RepID=UPI0020BF5864|nr:TlpA disulfide reductase family protein [Aquimarina acroporae]MCK8524077.1 TlpA family protein disulfide reductase [Aquimarina acroporae]
MNKVFNYIIYAVLAMIIVTYVYIKFSGAGSGEDAPDFETTLVDGTPFKLSSLKGEYVLLDFWGSWCPPCRRENPKLAKLHQKYQDKLTIVTVALEKDSVSWKKAAEKDGFIWKNQIVHQNRFVLLSPIARAYGVSEIPAKFLISPEGKLIGKLPTIEDVDRLLSELSSKTK